VSNKRFKQDRDVAEWIGPMVRYDLLKEVAICFLVVFILALGLAAIFSSPDQKPVTLKSWSAAAPVDFVQTAITELDGTSGTATYGPPFNSTAGAGQSIGPVSLERLAGVHIPINTAQDFVINPLLTLPQTPFVHAAIAAYEQATPDQQAKWTAAYEKAIANATWNRHLVIARGSYGPVGVMMSSLLAMARAGGLDGALVSSPQLYGTDYTKSLMFVADGGYLATIADSRHLSGDQWGMMNEAGNYPGQPWLWLYTMWYQIPPWSTSASGDALIWGTMMVLTILLALVPFIPGLRSIPRWTRIYKLIWRRHYSSVKA
jgi:hypothetical protein